MLLDAGLTPGGGAPLFLCWCTWSSPGCLPLVVSLLLLLFTSIKSIICASCAASSERESFARKPIPPYFVSS